MNIDKIQKLLEDLTRINEVLPKSVLKNLLPNFKFGIEIEMEHSELGRRDFEDALSGEEEVLYDYYNYNPDEEEYDEETDEYTSPEKPNDLIEAIDLYTELHELTPRWVVHDDGSLQNGVEFVSPPLDYEDFVKVVPKVVNVLKRLGYQGNERTGFHIGVSSTKTNLSTKIKNDLEYYNSELGYSKLVSAILAYNLDSKGLFSQGDVERQDSQYARDLISYIRIDAGEVKDYLRKADKERLSIGDIIYHGDKFVEGVGDFLDSVDRNIHDVSMTRRNDYVEFRGLGGSEAWESLDTPEFVRKLCIIIASQVSRKAKALSTSELYKVVRPYLRKINSDLDISGTPSDNRVKDKDLRVKIIELGQSLGNFINRVTNNEFVKLLESARYTFSDDVLNSKKIFMRYPNEITYMMIVGKQTPINSTMYNSALEYLPKFIDFATTDPEVSKTKVLEGVSMRLRERKTTVSDDVILKLAKGLSGVGSILEKLPEPTDYKPLIRMLYESGNDNGMTNAVFYDLENETDYLTSDEIYDYFNKLMLRPDSNFSYTVNGRLGVKPKYRDIYSKLLNQYPAELIDTVRIPTPEIMDILIKNNFNLKNKHGKYVNPDYSFWMKELISDYLKNPDEQKLDMVVKLTENMSSTKNVLKRYDSLPKEIYIALIRSNPRNIEYIKYPTQSIIDLVIELAGEEGLKWVENAGREAGWYDAWKAGGLRK